MGMNEAGRLIGSDNHLFPYEEAADMGGPLTEPLFVVCHYTAMLSEAADKRVLTGDDETYVSAHFHVGRDGLITQMVPLTRQAWHAGRSEWKGVTGLNAHSIGIEFANAGWLNVHRNGLWTREGMPGGVSPSQTIAADHPNGWPTGVRWEAYTDRQAEQGRGLTALLKRALPSIEEVVGHDQIAPDRKQDPGPAFPLAAMQAALHEGE